MTYLVDGTVDFSGGQNAGLTPDRIAKNQFQKGVNISCKNGSLQPRPRLRHVPVTVTTEGTEAGMSYQSIFDLGKFQGERVFLADDKSYALSVRGGLIFKINYLRGTAIVLRTATDDRISSLYRRVDIQQAGDYMVIFDWPNMPVVIRNDKARRSNWKNTDATGVPLPQVPQSRLGTFVQSRLWVANGNEFTAGDFVGDITRPDAPITFGEVFTAGAPFVGQAFNLGYGFGNMQITAMGYISSRNSQSNVKATIFGPLYVATRRSIHLYAAELPRAEWLQTNFGRLELWGVGITGQRAHSIIGSDVIFQSPRGYLHSFTKNQNDERSGWATTIISREVDNWLRTANDDFLDVGFVTYFNKVVFAGARPIRIPIKGYRGQVIYDYAHEGMVALELDNVSTITTPASPAWAGLWTGIRPMEATQIYNDLYVVSKDPDGYNRTYVLDEAAVYDTWNQQKRAVKGRVYMRAYDHEQPFLEKVEHSLDINLGNVVGDFNIKTFRKPLNAEEYAKWGEYDYKEKCYQDCAETLDGFAPNAPVGYKVLSFGDPVDKGCNKATGEPYSHYRENQVMVEFDGGDWRIDKVRLKAEVEGEPDSEGTPCTAEVKKQPTIQCDFVSDWDLYSIAPRVGRDD